MVVLVSLCGWYVCVVGLMVVVGERWEECVGVLFFMLVVGGMRLEYGVVVGGLKVGFNCYEGNKD